MRNNVFSDLQLVRIIEGPDKQGPDNQGCTVLPFLFWGCTYPVLFLTGRFYIENTAGMIHIEVLIGQI